VEPPRLAYTPVDRRRVHYARAVRNATLVSFLIDHALSRQSHSVFVRATPLNDI
jgi:hypothetical protein